MHIYDRDEQTFKFQHKSSKFEYSRYSISRNSIVNIEYINSFLQFLSFK